MLITLLAAGLSPSPAAAQENSRSGYFPNLPVVTQTGETVRFYDDVLKGRIVVISFLFTRCTEICPLGTARKAQLADRLGDLLGRSVHFVSISVDPENDSVEDLAAYAKAFHTGPGWTFLTGTPDNIRQINARLGERMRSLQDHKNEVLIGNEATGSWARNSVFGDLDRLEYEIRSMDPAWSATVRDLPASPAGANAHADTSLPGQALFIKLCAGCHGIGERERIGPDLGSVRSRRQHDWLVTYIMSPERMRARQDTIALELAHRYRSVRMPELGLSRADASDLLRYLQVKSEQRAQP
jgi:protein SCO1